MNRDDEKILNEVCIKHGIKPEFLLKLFDKEKEYADKNMETRRGIYKEIKYLIDFWARS